MKYKILPDVKNEQVLKQVEVDKITFNATPKLYKLLGDLESCDGFFEVLVIHDKVLASKLEKLKIVSQNVKGSYAPKNIVKLKKFKKIILHVVYGES